MYVLTKVIFRSAYKKVALLCWEGKKQTSAIQLFFNRPLGFLAQFLAAPSALGDWSPTLVAHVAHGPHRAPWAPWAQWAHMGPWAQWAHGPHGTIWGPISAHCKAKPWCGLIVTENSMDPDGANTVFGTLSPKQVSTGLHEPSSCARPYQGPHIHHRLVWA